MSLHRQNLMQNYSNIQYCRQQMPLTLLQQMQQVDALQQRTQKYYSLFVRSFQQQQERNEFLEASDVRSQQECLFSSTQKHKVYIQPQQEQQETYQSQLITTREDVNISRIFQDIVLADNPSKKSKAITVQLVLQNGQNTDLDLDQHKNNDFSLSNFSSFNVHRDDENKIQFRHLLECIQKTTGKTLSRTGIERIIEQITNQLQEMSKQSQKEKSKVETSSSHYLSCGESVLFDISHVNHKYDTALNNKAFSRNKADRHKLLQCSKNTSMLSANISVQQQKTVSPDNVSKSKPKLKLKENFVRQQKQNGPRISQKQPHNKQLRIIRKNNPKQLLMLYSDMRQVDQFCITNKIYGKQKEKVVKAVQSNKTSLTLQ